MNQSLGIGLITVCSLAVLGSGQVKQQSRFQAAQAKGTVTLTRSEYSELQKKYETFRASLSDRERQVMDNLMGGSHAGGHPEPAKEHQPGDRDSVGATKVNSSQIRDSDGSTTTCPPGSSVHSVDNGKGNFNWLCVSN